MLKNIFSFFLEDTSKEYSFYKLYSKIKEWGKTVGFPYDYELPERISFDDDFWKKIIQIQKSTGNDEHERAFSVFWADGELVITEVIKGSTSSVTTNSTVLVKYVQSRREGYAERQVYVDSTLYSKKEVYYKKVPSKIEVAYLFNVHTHPPVKVGEKTTYGFFSFTDINSFINSGAAITGMISDRVWLLIKTNKSPKIIRNYTQEEISIDSLNTKMNFGVYEGEFRKKLNRHLPKLLDNNPQVS